MTPLVDVVGNTGAVVPAQKAAIGSNVGTVVRSTVTVKLWVCEVRHCPGVAVKVYTNIPAVAVLIIAGDQLPVTPIIFVGSEMVELP